MMRKETGRIFKTIRADEADFWQKFVAELVEPEKEETRFEKRLEGDRKRFTVRLNQKKTNMKLLKLNSLQKN